MRNLKKWRFVGLAAVSLLLVATGPAVAGDGNSEVVGHGPDFVNPAVSPNPFANAVVTLSAGNIGQHNSQITLDVTGVAAPADTRFGAHVHVNPCGATASSSGGHYQNPDGGKQVKQREVWLDFSIDESGAGHAVATRDWRVSNLSDRSVVIHAESTDHETGAAGTRLACTDFD